MAYYSDLIGQKHYVYRAFIGDDLAYVGVTVNPAGRFANHSRKYWWREVTRVDLVECESRADAFAMERDAIRRENPTFNIARPPHEPEIRLVSRDV